MRRSSTARAACCAVLAALLVVPAGALAAPGSTVVVDRPSGFGPPSTGFGNGATLGGFSGSAVGDPVSGDPAGRYVVFASESDGLLPTALDDRAGGFVYELDRLTGAITLVSLDNAGQAVVAGAPSVSADGRRVAFTTAAAIDPADANGVLDAYVRDLDTQQTSLVSRRTGAAGTVAASFAPARIDADGDKVAFVTFASLEAADSNSKLDVYVRDLGARTTALVSRAAGAAGAVGDKDSYEPALNQDGTVVAFTSGATNLDPANDGNAFTDVFKREGTATTLVSARNGLSQAGDAGSNEPDLSPSGNTVAFTSSATNLVLPAYPHVRQVFRRGPAGTTLVSKSTGGAAGDGDSGGASLSVVGGADVVVGFHSDASNLVAGDGNGAGDIYVADAGDGTTRLVSRGAGPSGAVTVEGAVLHGVGARSRIVAYESSDRETQPLAGDFSHLYVRDMGDAAQPQTVADHAPGSGAPVPGDAGQGSFAGSRRALSDDGRYVVFVSAGDALLPGGDYREHVFRRDLLTGATILVDRADGPAGAIADRDPTGVAISADGNVVAFGTYASFDAADGNMGRDVYVRNVAAGTTRLASRADGAAGAVGDANADDPALSGDGGRVAWDTAATNLGDGDATASDDVHVRDLATGHTLLASRADGAAGANGNGGSLGPSLDRTGTVVAFTSLAANLADGDANSIADVHVRDLAAGTTRLASRAAGPGGAPGDGTSGAPSLSADGTRVAFETTAANLGDGDPDTTQDVHVRDLAAQTTTLVSRASGPAGVKGDSYSRAPAISADGGAVAFESVATTLTAGPVPGPWLNITNTYVRSLASATTELTSRADGPDGAAADTGRAYEAQIDGDGSCAAFVTDARSIAAAAGVSSDFTRVYVRVLRRGCPFVPATPPGVGPGPPQPPHAAPRITRARMTSTRFRVGPKRTATSAATRKRAPLGSRVDYTLSSAATVTLTVERAAAGRRSGKRCAKPARKLRKRKPCTRWVTAGTLERAGPAGARRVAFSGRIGRRALPAGRYRLRLRAVDSARVASATTTLAFSIVRR